MILWVVWCRTSGIQWDTLGDLFLSVLFSSLVVFFFFFVFHVIGSSPFHHYPLPFSPLLSFSVLNVIVIVVIMLRFVFSLCHCHSDYHSSSTFSLLFLCFWLSGFFLFLLFFFLSYYC